MSKGLPAPPLPELNSKALLPSDEFLTRCAYELSKLHGRPLSWEECYLFFQEHFSALVTSRGKELLKQVEVQLGHYLLASFRKYRNSSDLLELHRSVHGPQITFRQSQNRFLPCLEIERVPVRSENFYNLYAHQQDSHEHVHVSSVARPKFSYASTGNKKNALLHLMNRFLK